MADAHHALSVSPLCWRLRLTGSYCRALLLVRKKGYQHCCYCLPLLASLCVRSAGPGCSLRVCLLLHSAVNSGTPADEGMLATHDSCCVTHTVLHITARYGTVLYSTVRYSTALMVLYGTLWYSTVRHFERVTGWSAPPDLAHARTPPCFGAVVCGFTLGPNLSWVPARLCQSNSLLPVLPVYDLSCMRRGSCFTERYALILLSVSASFSGDGPRFGSVLA